MNFDCFVEAKETYDYFEVQGLHVVVFKQNLCSDFTSLEEFVTAQPVLIYFFKIVIEARFAFF